MSSPCERAGMGRGLCAGQPGAAQSPGDSPRGRFLQGLARDDQDGSTASRLLLGLCSTPAQCEPHSALSKWAGPGPRERGRGQNGPQCALLPSARLLLRHAPMKRVWGTERCSGTDRGLAGLEGGGAGGVLTFTDSRGPRPRSRPSYLTSLGRFLLGRAAVETVRPGVGWEPSEHPACSCP